MSGLNYIFLQDFFEEPVLAVNWFAVNPLAVNRLAGRSGEDLSLAVNRFRLLNLISVNSNCCYGC